MIYRVRVGTMVKQVLNDAQRVFPDVSVTYGPAR